MLDTEILEALVDLWHTISLVEVVLPSLKGLPGPKDDVDSLLIFESGRIDCKLLKKDVLRQNTEISMTLWPKLSEITYCGLDNSSNRVSQRGQRSILAQVAGLTMQEKSESVVKVAIGILGFGSHGSEAIKESLETRQ